MNEKCRYCRYLIKCSEQCEYDSALCLLNRSFPKFISKTYEELVDENEELVEENKKYKEVINKLNNYMGTGYLINTKDIKDILKEWKRKWKD